MLRIEFEILSVCSVADGTERMNEHCGRIMCLCLLFTLCEIEKFTGEPTNAERWIVSFVKSREKTANGVQLNVRNNENEKRYNFSCPVELFRHLHPYHAINVQAIQLHMEMCLWNRYNTFVIFICIYAVENQFNDSRESFDILKQKLKFALIRWEMYI